MKKYLLFWLIINIIINSKIKNILLAQSIVSLLNGCILVFDYFVNIKDLENVIFFICYYLCDLLYYLIFYLTNIDLKYNKDNKGNRILYTSHHIISIIILYLSFINRTKDCKIYYYTSVFIVLFEISTIFLDINEIFHFLEQNHMSKYFDNLFNFSFIICRVILFNIIFFKLIMQKHLISIKKSHLNISIMILLIMSLSNISYILNKLNNKTIMK